MDPTTTHIQVGTASGQPMPSESTCDILIPWILYNSPTTGHVVPVFQENLVGVVPMCDTDYKVTFTKHAFTL